MTATQSTEFDRWLDRFFDFFYERPSGRRHLRRTSRPRSPLTRLFTGSERRKLWRR